MPSSSQAQGQRDSQRNTRAQGQPHPAQSGNQQQHPAPQAPPTDYGTFLAGYNETRRYTVLELIGKGSYGVVCSAKDNLTGEVVAIKKIQNVFDNVADAHRILREITLLRLLKHPDIVEVKHIMLPSDPNSFKDLYVCFELMESDLHTVIGANDDLTRDHHKVFLYQLLRGLNFMHTNGVLHRDLKPKNILANSNCKLKICDFGLARPCMGGSGSPLTPVSWTDYVATRWYRAPELCGSFYGQYNSAVDMWSIGCIFAEVLLGKPLFPGRDAVSQLNLITDLLGKPAQSVIEGIGNARARKFLQSMAPKEPRPLSSKFPNADPLALDLLARMLAFDPVDRPTAAVALAHPYFAGLPNAVHQESVPVASNFEFECCPKLTEADVRHLIYREALQYHPQVLMAYESQMAALRNGLGAVDLHIPTHTNPYTLASTPSDSVSLQFMLQQSDSQDSSVEGEVANVLPPASHAPLPPPGFAAQATVGTVSGAVPPPMWRMQHPQQQPQQQPRQQVQSQPLQPLQDTQRYAHAASYNHLQQQQQQHYQAPIADASDYYRQQQQLQQQHLQQQQRQLEQYQQQQLQQLRHAPLQAQPMQQQPQHPLLHQQQLQQQHLLQQQQQLLQQQQQQLQRTSPRYGSGGGYGGVPVTSYYALQAT
ncbi:hypothetical protein Agub_g2018 [Astrephomene gubernaculifera]|uniref:Protein kinase domain-containing protein n=1 Tax=Astrephomene gubernaculifera TaxID=47775 RepID=A0AAD3DIJ0_9CHLO|nr:hypothetical protein Agub_g2018 [Astrephomene gubernaculifera]